MSFQVESFAREVGEVHERIADAAKRGADESVAVLRQSLIAAASPPEVAVAPEWRRNSTVRSDLALFGFEVVREHGCTWHRPRRPAGALRYDDCPVEGSIDEESVRGRTTGLLVVTIHRADGERQTLSIERSPEVSRAGVDDDAEIKRRDRLYRERCKRLAVDLMRAQYEEWRKAAPARMAAVEAYRERCEREAREAAVRVAWVSAREELLKLAHEWLESRTGDDADALVGRILEINGGAA